MPTQSAYVPSMSELTQGGNPSLGTVPVGANYGENHGIDLLYRAATQTAAYNWQKHQEIEQRKADVFKNIRDLSAVSVMPEDKKMLNEKMGSLLKQVIENPGIFSGGNEEARLKFEADTADWGSQVHNSKQDYVNWEIDKKTAAENPEYQNPPNAEYLSNFPKDPLGSRKYGVMIPTPVVDYGLIRKASQPGGIRKLEDTFEIGDYTTVNGKQQFKPNSNGKWLATTTGATEALPEVITQNFKNLVGTPQFRKTIKPDLDYQYKWVLTPEERKKYTNGDGSVNYELMLKPQIDLAIAEAVATPGTTKYDDNPFALQSQKDAAALRRANVRAANQTAPTVTRDLFTPLYNTARYGNGNAKVTRVNGIEVGVNLNSLDTGQQNAILPLARKALGDKVNVGDILVRYNPSDGKLKIIDYRKLKYNPENKEEYNAVRKQGKNWEIPSDAYVVDINPEDLNLGANETLGNPAQQEVIKQGQQTPPVVEPVPSSTPDWRKRAKKVE